jgi:hypothetical protein
MYYRHTRWWLAGLVAVGIAIYGLTKFEDFLAQGRWVDRYPLSSNKLSELIKKEGAGTYNLLPQNKDISAVCVSVWGTDPRQVAVDLLGFDPQQLKKDQAFFVMERTVSFIFLQSDNEFSIEPIDRHLVDFPGASDQCVRTPTTGRITVRNGWSKFTGANLVAVIELN